MENSLKVNTCTWLLASAVMLAMITCASSIHDANNSSLSELETDRVGKFFPFYTVVRFSNIECNGNNNLLGTCYLKEDCAKEKGAAFGSCAKRLGVCCVVIRNCGGAASKSNNTYYRNPGFPDTFPGGSRCTISIAKVRDAVCQIRLDFTRLALAQPTGEGNCVTDYLIVSGTDTQIPKICGTNDGQHVYLKFQNDGSPIQLTIVTTSAINFNRQWDIRVSQHECPNGAPSGCLQYFTGVAGSISSFNYADTENNPVGTRQLVSQQYSVCVRPEAGYCGIEWSQASPNSFTVSGNTAGITPDLLGTPSTGSDCKGDFVIIPNALQNLMSVNADRFCGNALIPTRSLLTPMILTVVNDDTDIASEANRGFQLKYRQIVCP